LSNQEEKKMGRPSLGLTKKVSITLPQELWDKLEIAKVSSKSSSMSELLRKIIVAAID
jgi:metal-responsive CopG/Arc/MetJ family transcriptional regulator